MRTIAALFALTFSASAWADVPLTWSAWASRDTPGGSGDYEDLKVLYKEGRLPCLQPIAIEARRVRDKAAVHRTGESIALSTNFGLKCVNAKQADRACDDYEIRIACGSPGLLWSAWVSRDTPSGSGDHEVVALLHSEGKVPCAKPVALRARRVRDGVDALLAGEVVSLSTTGLACANAKQPDGRCEDYAVRIACAPAGTPGAHTAEPTTGESGSAGQTQGEQVEQVEQTNSTSP